MFQRDPAQKINVPLKTPFKQNFPHTLFFGNNATRKTSQLYDTFY